MDAEDIQLKNINDLDENSSVNDSDNLMVGNAGTNTLRRLSLSNLFDAIKSRISSWTFSGFNTSSKTITGAVNEIRNERVSASDFSVISYEESAVSCDSGSYTTVEFDVSRSGYRPIAAWPRTSGLARLICVGTYLNIYNEQANTTYYVSSGDGSVTRSTVEIEVLYVRSS